MKVEELSIGDWVNVLNYHWDGTSFADQVEGITKKHGTYYLQFGSSLYAEIDRCEPIPITPEILEKNGFYPIYENDKDAYKWKEYYDNYHYHSIIIDFRVKCASGVWSDRTRRAYKGDIVYVHELQRILKLCGITKPIEL